ncbi:unnamed protein product, partial [Ixodes hexagonus]
RPLPRPSVWSERVRGRRAGPRGSTQASAGGPAGGQGRAADGMGRQGPLRRRTPGIARAKPGSARDRRHGHKASRRLTPERAFGTHPTDPRESEQRPE